MKVHAKLLIAALAALILSSVMADPVEAGCNDRINSGTATCLSGRIAYNTWGDMYAKAKNLCHENGSLVARVVVPDISQMTSKIAEIIPRVPPSRERSFLRSQPKA